MALSVCVWGKVSHKTYNSEDHSISTLKLTHKKFNTKGKKYVIYRYGKN